MTRTLQRLTAAGVQQAVVKQGGGWLLLPGPANRGTCHHYPYPSGQQGGGYHLGR
ncbi:hypothetical protein [Aeromonas veronii]|uniref:hypothetical protein n=1 Tax=Aeromonas veronii TaxID=654 RepID=UPI0024447A01|nr:hypothetical protein [Aeromonas veronii]